MFRLTDAAAAQVQLAAAQVGIADPCLRLAVMRKVDGSFDYRMGFDDAQEEDIHFNCAGIKLIMAPEYAPLLDQTTLDFVILEEEGWQFIFINPLDPYFVPPQE